MHPVPPPSVLDRRHAVSSNQRDPLRLVSGHLSVTVDKGGVSTRALTPKMGISYPTAWKMHHKIQHAMADRNIRYQLGGLVVEWNDAYFGGVSHVPGKRGRGTDQDPVIVGVSLTEHIHPQYAFLEVVESCRKRQCWRSCNGGSTRMGSGSAMDRTFMLRERKLISPITESPSVGIRRLPRSFME